MNYNAFLCAALITLFGLKNQIYCPQAQTDSFPAAWVLRL
jgi:hypothetical protein